jgi:hypothetical protein
MYLHSQANTGVAKEALRVDIRKLTDSIEYEPRDTLTHTSAESDVEEI